MITCMTVMPCASRREVQLLDMHRVKYSEGGRGGDISHCGNISCTVRGRQKHGNGLEVHCSYNLAGKKKLLDKIETV